MCGSLSEGPTDLQTVLPIPRIFVVVSLPRAHVWRASDRRIVMQLRVRKDAVSCPKCSRNIASRHVRCIYCGEPRTNNEAFSNVF